MRGSSSVCVCNSVKNEPSSCCTPDVNTSGQGSTHGLKDQFVKFEESEPQPTTNTRLTLCTL